MEDIMLTGMLTKGKGMLSKGVLFHQDNAPVHK